MQINQIARQKAVVGELRARAAAAAEEARKKTQPTNRTDSAPREGPLDKHSKRPSQEQLENQWMRAIAKKGLSMDFADDREVRKAITMTAKAGMSFVDGKTYDCKMPRRYKMTNTVLPRVDAELDGKICKRIDALMKKTGCVLLSDGWTSVSSRPIINALLSTPAGTRFLKAIDTSGSDKDAEYIADFMTELIRMVDPENVVAVCMDGACKSSFPIITKEFPWIHCFICPTHSLDNFLKNVLTDQEDITVRDVGTYPWGENVFSEPTGNAWRVIKFIVNHQKSLARWRVIASKPETWEESGKPDGGTELLKYGETRYASRILMGSRLLNTKVLC